jgi:hypothetical protein
VKYSTYLVKKLGRTSLGASDSKSIDLSAAVNAAGTPAYPGSVVWPSSFADVNAVVVVGTGVTAAIDTATQTLQVSNVAPLTGEALVKINAGPSFTISSADYDKGILEVYPNLVTNASFDSGTAGWNTQVYADGTLPFPIPTTVASFLGRTNVFKANLAVGQKIQSSQVVTTVPSQWYTARAKVATDAAPSTAKLKTYLYLQDDPIGGIKFSAHDVGANGMMDGPNVWNQMEISFFARSTDCAVQIVSICPASATTPGALYWDDVEVFQAAPAVIDPDLTYGNTKVAVTNSTFDANTAGWYPEVYADGSGIGTIAWVASQGGKNGVYSIAQTPGQKAKISQFGVTGSLAPLAEQLVAGKSVRYSVWVYSNAASQAGTGKYYAYVYSYDSGWVNIRRSMASIVQPGGNAAATWSQIQVGGVMFTSYGAIQIVAIDQASQAAQTHYFDDVTLAMDKDPIYFWDATLFP